MLRAQTSPTLNWQMFSGSMNLYNSIRPFAKPLQYNEALNTISFVQRKSLTYSCSPDPGVLGQSGVIVAMISSNWGAQWDSSCIWTDTSHFGRFPQGAIANPPGNHSLSNAYIVGSGPVVNTIQFDGFFTASKALGPGNYNNSPGTATNAMQHFPNSSTLGNCYHASNAFSATGDGLVRCLAYLSDPSVVDMNRGAMLLTGTIANNAISWSSDSLVCHAAYYGGGYKSMDPEAMMAWNTSGTVGYVVFMASRYGSQLSNKGWQPVVYKSTDSGNSWTIVASMDFNSSDALYLKQRLAPVGAGNPNAGLVIPQVQPFEGWDMVVDKQDGLHIAAILNGAAHSNLDSIYARRFYGTEGYAWEHKPGRRPYLVDFMLSANGNWSYGIVDSLSSEASQPGNGPGSFYNPWGGSTGTSPVTNVARVQCSRSADGKYVLISWAESDTLLTTQQTKWNSKPDLKLRLIDCDSYQISPTELNLSVNSNSLISGRASMHYMSPTSSHASLQNGHIRIRVPFTLSTQDNFFFLQPCQHWFVSDSLSFSASLIPFNQTISVTSASDESYHELNSLSIYPNPCADYIELRSADGFHGDCNLILYDLSGRELFRCAQDLTSRKIALPDLPSGSYLLRISLNGTVAWKKLLKN